MGPWPPICLHQTYSAYLGSKAVVAGSQFSMEDGAYRGRLA